ncbi:hypothetical protein JHK82_024487 [Glycine max]|nr:hypothetical protein JHK85_025084 [Glycine max]KAG5012323.1 hypothetical protein JHK86_024584 [Glycine max]KAG5133299.1 hypothetical protein JHK82_024487 [Glycine max]
MTFPPKGLSLCMMSFKLLSSASKLNLILHVEFCVVDTGIANLKCVVLPPGSSNDAIPLEATVMTIPPLDRIAEDKVFQINVFPLPP